MFSTPDRLQQRTPVNGVGREEYLNQLVDEYIHTKNHDAKCQVLANLANFAYDPLNSGWLREAGALDIFLHVLRQETDECLKHFACVGLCNSCLDPANAENIIENGGIDLLLSALNSSHAETLTNAITTLIYLNTDKTHTTIAAPSVIETVVKLKDSDEKCISNLAVIFLNDIAGMNIKED